MGWILGVEEKQGNRTEIGGSDKRIIRQSRSETHLRKALRKS